MTAIGRFPKLFDWWSNLFVAWNSTPSLIMNDCRSMGTEVGQNRLVIVGSVTIDGVNDGSTRWVISAVHRGALPVRCRGRPPWAQKLW